jgi:hypothetical protein
VPEHCAAHDKFEMACVDCKAARRETALTWHDTHQVRCPACNRSLFFTDSPSMIQEAKADGVESPPMLIQPIQSMLQGERAKIFPLKCGCGHEYVSFIDVVNVGEMARVRNDILPYYPNLEGDLNFQKRYLTPKRRDVVLTKEEFAQRVARERNPFVREALERKCDAAGLGIKWVRPQYVARLVEQ